MQLDDDNMMTTNESSYAYWLQRTIREAIYGRVLIARVIKRRSPNLWELTDETIAVKEMSWQHIRRERHRLAEDPIQEVAALQYLKTNFDQVDMESVNVMFPKDILSDQRYLYSVMPYCNGGELFERLDMNERFTEPEARYWMDQLLNGIYHLESVGVCHRDISLENVLVHNDRISLIIDLGMCVRYPNDEGQHVLISPQGTCGKWIYMSPEIFKNRAFHGPSIDLWAAGVILFLLLTGFPPWDRACDTDERYRYMSSGYLVQMLTEWQIPISADAKDLLQRMLFADPADRLSLQQVRAHPWMANGPRHPPSEVFDELEATVASGR